MGVSFLNLLVGAGDPLRKFHTYAAGMSVIAELTNGKPNPPSTTQKSKRKRPERDEDDDDNDDDGKEPKDKYCLGKLS